MVLAPVLLSLVLLGAAAAPAREGDLCAFEPATLYDLAQFEDCVAQIPLDVDDVALPTLDTLEKLLDLFVFEEMAKKPIAPYDDPTNAYKLAGVDVREGVRQVRERVEGGEFSTDFEFHSALSAVFLPLKDPHTVYAKPAGYKPFYLTLPVTFEARADVNDPTGVSLFLRGLPGDDLALTDAFAERVAAQGGNLASLLGRKILSINGRPPLEAVQGLADEVSYISKNPSSRFNSALQKDFYSRGLWRMNLPSGSVDDPREYSFALDGGETLQVPVFATVSKPVEGQAWIEEQNRPAAAAPSPAASSPAARETPLTRFLRDVRPEPARRAPRAARAAQTPVHAADGKDYRFELVHDGVDISLHLLSGTSPEHAGEWRNLAYMLSIRTFGPDDPHVFTADFQASLAEVQKGYEKAPGWPIYLIVNVMGNGGGYITLGYRSLHALAPHVNPVYGNYTIRKNDLSHYFATSGNFSTQKRYELPTWKEVDARDWFDDSKEVMSFPAGTTMDVSKTYTFDLAYDEVIFEDAFVSLWATPTPDFLRSGNSRLVFVTDGLCGSTCSCFSKRAREARAGLFLGVGGNPAIYDSRDTPMDVASFAGGSVMDTTFVFDDDHRKDLSKRHNLEPLPTSALFRWAFEQIFSWDATQEYSPVSTPLEYVNNPVDDYIEYWPGPGVEYQSEEHLASIAIAAFEKVSSKCYDFQVEPSAECEAQTPEGSHLLLGAACVGGDFQPNVCKFMECEVGYVLNADGSCTPQPAKQEIGTSPVETAAYICLGIIAGVIVIGLILFFLLKFIKRGKGGKASKSSGQPDDAAAAQAAKPFSPDPKEEERKLLPDRDFGGLTTKPL